MRDLSLHLLDLAQNSITAGASLVTVRLTLGEDRMLTMELIDNGKGMSPELLARVTSPFATTRTTRKVGLGIPFLTMLAEMTGGFVTVTSTHESVSPNHGTKTEAKFGKNHIDFIPLGDIVETVKTLIQGAPDVNFTFRHIFPNGTVELSCAAIRETLGDEIPLSEPDVLTWIGQYLREQYDDLGHPVAQF